MFAVFLQTWKQLVLFPTHVSRHQRTELRNEPSAVGIALVAAAQLAHQGPHLIVIAFGTADAAGIDRFQRRIKRACFQRIMQLDLST